MWMRLVGRPAFSHGLSQPIDQCTCDVWVVIYCDLTLSVCTGRNLSVRVDRSTEVVGRHTTPDASNYSCVSVGGGEGGGLRALPFVKTTSGTGSREAAAAIAVAVGAALVRSAIFFSPFLVVKQHTELLRSRNECVIQVRLEEGICFFRGRVCFSRCSHN